MLGAAAAAIPDSMRKLVRFRKPPEGASDWQWCPWCHTTTRSRGGTVGCAVPHMPMYEQLHIGVFTCRGTYISQVSPGSWP